jgi:hypothetical protein
MKEGEGRKMKEGRTGFGMWAEMVNVGGFRWFIACSTARCLYLGRRNTKYSASRNIPVQNISASRNIPVQIISASRNISVQNISASRNIPVQNIQPVGIFQYKIFSQ